MRPNYLLAIATILLLTLSVYFSVAVSAQSIDTGPRPITLYHQDLNGKLSADLGNLYTSGEPLWILLPDGASSPYWLTITNEHGTTLWSQLGSTIPTDNLLSIQLAPRIIPPNHEYSLALQVTRENLPGISVLESYQSAFIVSPGYGQLSLESFSRVSGSIISQIRLVDPGGRPSVGVRVGLFLVQGNGSLPISSESTNSLGTATFRVGESITGGQYSLEARILDNVAFIAAPLPVSSFIVDSRPSSVLAWQSSTSTITGSIREARSLAPVSGRLLLLEQRLSDGNLVILTSSYSDDQGIATFARASTTESLQVSFKGDETYGPSSSLVSSITLSSTSISPSVQSPILSPAPLVSPAVGSISTTTSLLLPSTAYSTIPIVATAVVKDTSGNPISSAPVTFSKDTVSIGSATTNTTGAATLVWTPNTISSHTISASFPGNSTYQASSAQQALSINQTPTTTMILKPLPIAYSWDLYLNNTATGRPIVVPVVTLTLALSGNGSPANIYTPAYNGSSTIPPVVPGYGWAGLNQSSAVTMTFNSTYTQTQTMSWTSNFYLPPCPTPSLCIPFPDTGHMFLNATLAPPSNLYSRSSTTLNIPISYVDGVPNATSTLTQNATPPSNLYVNVNATIPYISIKLQSLPVALSTYADSLAYSLGSPSSSSVQCTKSGCVNSYTLPILSPSRGADFAFACMASGCNTPAANVQLSLYNSKGMQCVTTTTDSFGIAPLNITGSKNCTYPYSSISTPSTSVTVSELFALETASRPGTVITNFQGFYYTIYAPQRATRYLLNIHATSQVSVYTVLYPTPNIPDVKPAILGCCDVFLTVSKHNVQVLSSASPTDPTVLDSINATIRMVDQQTKRTLTSASFNYTLTRSTPGPSIIAQNTATTDTTGIAKLPFGLLAYGNYTFTVTRSGNATENSASRVLNFTIVLAKPTMIITPGWIQNAIPLQTYLFTTSLVNNATGVFVRTSGLLEQVYVNDVLYSKTWLCTASGCSFANYYLTNPGGNVTFPWVAPTSGQYKIQVIFPSQSFYGSTSITIMVAVSSLQVTLSVASSVPEPDVGQQVTWNVYAYAMINNMTAAGLPIREFLDGVNTTAITTDSAGFASFTPPPFMNKGLHNVTFTSSATGVYSPAISYNPILVFVETSLALKGGTLYLGQQNTLTVTLTNSSGNPLSGRTVQIEISGIFYQNVTTDSTGHAQFTWKPTALGRYSITAVFTATGSGNIGYKPSTTTAIVNIAPKVQITTSTTTGGTQSITFNTGSGSILSGLLPSITVSFPSLTALVITVSFQGVTIQASVAVHAQFGLLCVARINTILGSICVLSMPFEKLYLDASVSAVVDFHFINQLFGPASTAYNVLASPPVDIQTLGDGIQASVLIAGIAVGTSLTPALGVHLAGELVLESYIAAAGIGEVFYGWKTNNYRDYLYGMLIPAILGVPCALKFIGCAASLAPIIEAVPDGQALDVLDTPLAVLGWGFYYRFGVLTSFQANDPWPFIETMAGVAVAAAALGLQG